METNNVTRVTRALRKRLNSIESDNLVGRPNTPQTDLEVIQENANTPARRTRQNSKDVGTPINMPPATPARRTTRRNSITAEASPAIVASPLRRTTRRLNSVESLGNANEIIVKPSKNQISTIIHSVVEEDDDDENFKERSNDKNIKRVTRSSSISPKSLEEKSVKVKKTEEYSVKRVGRRKLTSENQQTPGITLIYNSDSESDDISLNTIKSNDKISIAPKSPNISKNIKENSIRNSPNHNEQSINKEKTPKMETIINQSSEDRQRMRSVTFNNSDENINSPKKFPKTPISSKSKSFIDGTILESSKEISDNSLKCINNSKNEKSFEKEHETENIKVIDNDNSTKDIQNEKSNSETPYKELKLKGSVISSSTPINMNDHSSEMKSKKLYPIVRLAKNYNSVIEKSKDKVELVPTKFSTSWSQAIRGNVDEKIDTLNSNESKVEELIQINDSKILKKSKKVMHPSDDEEEEEENNVEKCEFVDDEADEMDGEESIDEEERQYLKDNEIPITGEILGSEDTEEEEEDENEYENDSFLIEDTESEKNLILSTDSEKELIEDVKKVKKTSYKRIKIADDSDDDDDNNKSDGEVHDTLEIKTEINDKSFTVDKSISIINISTDGDEVFSNKKKSSLNVSKDVEGDKLNTSGKYVSNKNSFSKESYLLSQNSPNRKSLNTSGLSGINVLNVPADSDNDMDQIHLKSNLNRSKNNKSLNRSNKSDKQKSITETNIQNANSCCEDDQIQKLIKNINSSTANNDKSEKYHDDQNVANKSSLKSPKNRKISMNKSHIMSPENYEKNDLSIKNKSLLKSPKNKNVSINKSIIMMPADESDENEDINDENEILHKSSVRSPKNKKSTIDKSQVNAENNYVEEIEADDDSNDNVVNKSLKSPKNKSFNNSKFLLQSENNDSESGENEEFENTKFLLKSGKNKNNSMNKSNILKSFEEETAINKSLPKSPKNKNSSIINNSNQDFDDHLSEDSQEENEVSKNLFIESPINPNSSKNKSLNKSKNSEKDKANEESWREQVSQIKNKSPKNFNNSRKSETNKNEEAAIVQIQFHSENSDKDSSDDDDDIDYVPQDNENEIESNSSTNSDDAEELIVELEKINEEKNIPKEKLSYSFTSVTENRPVQHQNKFSKSFTIEHLRVSNDQNKFDNSSQNDPEKDDKNSNISDNIDSETEDLENLKSDEFKLKQSKRKSMMEHKNENLVIQSKKSRHSLGSTHVDVQEEIFQDLREKLETSKKNKTINEYSLCDEEKQKENNTKLNKSLGEKQKIISTTEGNFHHVTHILNRCDEILEAANLAKREAKLANKKNKSDKPKKIKSKKRKLEENSDSSDTAEQNQVDIKLKEAAIAKALKHREIILRKKNTEENLDTLSSSIKTSKLLSNEILEAIQEVPIINNKKLSKDAQIQHSKYQSESSPSEISDIENKAKTANKLKHTIAFDRETVLQPKKKKSQNILTNPSGMFVEQPITPPPKNKNGNGGNIRKIISKQVLPSGTVYEEPVTPDSKKIMNGFKECPITPKAIGFKVRSILSAGQKEPPLILNSDKNLQKRKRKNIPEPIRCLPKPKWTSSGEFIVEKIENKIDLDESIATDFYVIPLEMKKTTKSVKNQKQFFGINSNALEFKKNAMMMNSKVRRETSKEMLQRKERQNIYNKF